jgi:hypothetical protein
MYLHVFLSDIYLQKISFPSSKREGNRAPKIFFFAAATGKLRGMFVQRNAVRLSEAPIFK